MEPIYTKCIGAVFVCGGALSALLLVATINSILLLYAVQYSCCRMRSRYTPTRQQGPLRVADTVFAHFMPPKGSSEY